MNIAWIILSLFIDHRVGGLYSAASRLPDVRPELVEPAVRSALLVETNNVPASLIIAISWGETRFEPKNVTGTACGPISTICYSRHDCQSVMNYIDGYTAGVHELEDKLRDKRVRGNMRLALLYFACGNSAFDGTCQKKQWPDWVLQRARGLERHVRYQQAAAHSQ